MNEQPVTALFKLGMKAHLAELLQEGHVFMNTVSYFAGLEDDSPRADPDEGTGFSRNAHGWTVEIQEKDESVWHAVGTLEGPIRFREKALATANLYCLHTRTERDYGIIFELDKLGFGDSFVLFLDPNEFLRRLREAAAKAGQEVVTGMVEYVDRRSYTGPMGVFRKFSERAEDREFRLAALPGTGQPLSLRLGDLSDIAIMGTTDKRMRMDPNVTPNEREITAARSRGSNLGCTPGMGVSLWGASPLSENQHR